MYIGPPFLCSLAELIFGYLGELYTIGKQYPFFSKFSVQLYNTLVSNGYCNDETNNAENNYDGGDCCGYDANTEYCVVCG